MEFIKNIQNGFSFNSRIILELIVALTLFSFIFLDYVSLFTVIAHLLSFIIVLEVVRMLMEFSFNKNHVMKLRYVIDGAILFFLRDLILIVSDENYKLEYVEDKVFFLLKVISVLFIFRILALLFSPNDKNCEQCVAVPFKFKQKDN